jgi:hypothetical protein
LPHVVLLAHEGASVLLFGELLAEPPSGTIYPILASLERPG